MATLAPAISKIVQMKSQIFFTACAGHWHCSKTVKIIHVGIWFQSGGGKGILLRFTCHNSTKVYVIESK